MKTLLAVVLLCAVAVPAQAALTPGDVLSWLADPQAGNLSLVQARDATAVGTGLQWAFKNTPLTMDLHFLRGQNEDDRVVLGCSVILPVEPINGVGLSLGLAATPRSYGTVHIGRWDIPIGMVLTLRRK